MENKKLRTKEKKEQLVSELREFLNRHSLDNHCSTPDFILSDMLLNMLDVLAEANNRRDSWLGLPDKNALITLEDPHGSV